MLFIKVIKNHVKQTKIEYNRIIKRRKERLLKFIEYDSPRIIIVNEIELLREPFYKFFMKKYIKKFYNKQIFF